MICPEVLLYLEREFTVKTIEFGFITLGFGP